MIICGYDFGNGISNFLLIFTRWETFVVRTKDKSSGGDQFVKCTAKLIINSQMKNNNNSNQSNMNLMISFKAT